MHRNGQVVLGFERDVVCAGLCWRSIWTTVNPKHGEVSRVTRPNPIVGVPTILADGAWRSPNQSHICIGAGDDEKMLIAVQEIPDDSIKIISLCGLHDQRLPHRFLGFLSSGSRGLNRICDVLDALDEHGGQARIHQFFLHGHGPKSILEDVPLQAAVGLNLTVPAMVVGQQQALIRDQAGCAASAKLHNGILQ